MESAISGLPLMAGRQQAFLVIGGKPWKAWSPFRIYEGSQDHPFGPYIGEIPPRPEPVPPEPAHHNAVTVQTGEVKTLISPLVIAADYKRD